ncbi:MAG: SpoIIE family protein phosphatase [Bacteroidales bacterium]|nr:SpoIIE family protein phosphatase [Bacteroidales bacterium]
MTQESQTIQQRLDFANFKLKSLLGITLAINANKPARELLDKYQQILCTGLNIKTLAVFIVSIGWKKVISVGIEDNFGDNADEVSSTLSPFSEITDLSKREEPFFRNFDVLIPVFHKDIQLAYVLLGENRDVAQRFERLFDHLDIIQTLTNIVAVALENKRLYKKSLEQESLKAELEVASKLQAMLIPNANSIKKNDFISVSTYYHPHSMVGGDYYDFIQLNDSDFGFCIADVSGKGISAAMLMANFQANLRILFKKNIPLVSLIRDLNQNVNNSSQGDRFVTFFVGKYSAKRKSLHYINAGHNPPLLLRKDTSDLVYLTAGCVGLGMLEEIPKITAGTIGISSGDKLLCYTDGLIEAENEQGEMYGTIPLEGALTIEGNADDVIHYLKSDLDTFVGDKALTDDISILGIDFL